MCSEPRLKDQFPSEPQARINRAGATKQEPAWSSPLWFLGTSMSNVDIGFEPQMVPFVEKLNIDLLDVVSGQHLKPLRLITHVT
jgi:hypothetical protein